MAETLDDGEFWLPAQFLTDDEILMDTKSFGSFGVSSDLSSTVGSSVGSSETESDEEEYIADLSMRIAHTTLEDVLDFKKKKSTLCAVGTQGTWYLLHAAAGEVDNIWLNDGRYRFNRSRRVADSPVRRIPFSYQLSPANQAPMIKQRSSRVWGGETKKMTGFKDLNHHLTNEIVQNRGRYSEFIGAGKLPHQQQNNGWNPVQQPSSGMRAVFLGNPIGRRESAGTGVFLPRQIGAQSGTRKKSACATALVPAKVMQALNRNLDDFSVQSHLQPRFTGMNHSKDALLEFRSGVASDQKRNMMIQLQPAVKSETQLPREWTY